MKKTAALLWDESYIWGIMSMKALYGCRLPFEIIKSQELNNSLSDRYNLLYVPGGWASNKIKAIGESGIRAIKEFVSSGGTYIGLCGGAGLASKDGIGLLNVKRMPTAQRVPSLSGRVLAATSGHAIFEGIKDGLFHVWWPSQFIPEPDSVSILASYKEVFDDSFSADLSVGAVRRYGQWEEFERHYGINLDPSRLKGSPLFLEGYYGKGKVLLSLIHFDTPEDNNGHRVLKNLWNYAGISDEIEDLPQHPRVYNSIPEVDRLENLVEELISFGIENFLWFWRNPMILQWRRGIRGLECCNLYVIVKELCGLIKTSREAERYASQLSVIQSSLCPFLEDLKRLLFLERQEMMRSHLTYVHVENDEIRTLRDSLFSKSKSYGGKYKSLLGLIDSLFYDLIKQQQRMKDFNSNPS